MTAVAALMLYEEGLVALDDPIAEHLPEFQNLAAPADDGKPAQQEVIVRHLFTHTSGMKHPRNCAEKYAFPTMAAYMQDFAKLPLQAQPGAKWIYGDSLDMLGYLVERVSGQRPDLLGMTDTHYWPPAAKQRRRAVLGVNGKDDPQRLSREPPATAEARTFISGASGLHTTAADYWRFCQMLLNDGGFGEKRLLGPRTVAPIAENHLEEGTRYAPGTGFGLGFAVVTDRSSAAFPYSNGSYYWGGSQGTLFWIDPAEQLAGMLMVQARPSRPLKLRQKFAALVYSAIVD